MAIIPKVLIKKGDDIKDIYIEYGLRVISFPFLFVNAKPKNIATRKYYDQDGDYVYTPSVIRYESQDFTVRFAYKGDKNSTGLNISSFISYISNTEISIYCDFLKIGRQRVRVLEIPDNADLNRTNTKDVIEFDVVFRSEDPINNITLSL